MPTNITALLEPAAVAVIGASADPRKIGGRPIDYLRRFGFPGRIVGVNPARQEVQGVACVPNIADAGAIDLAILATPQDGAEPAVLACLKAGVKGLILFTAGYAEVGAEGRKAQQRLADAAREAGAALLGPNCLGTLNVPGRLPATFATTLEALDPKPGGFSYVGQSGALGAYWLEMADSAGMGIAKWITLGNEAQVTGADAIAYLAADAQTRIIGTYIEDIKVPDEFASAAQAASRAGKTIIAIKSGRSAAGARAAAAHTASEAGDAGWYADYLAECGVIQVASLTEMIDTARLVGLTPDGAAPRHYGAARIGMVTVSGGAGVLACDMAADHGLSMAALTQQDCDALRAFLPFYAAAANPIDVTGAVVTDRGLLPRALKILGQTEGCDVLLLFFGGMASIADDLVAAVRGALGYGKPVVVIWMAGPLAALAEITAAGVPVFTDIPPAIAAIARLSAMPSLSGTTK
jgi:acyl-CoA synthetase (NDP forming)